MIKLYILTGFLGSGKTTILQNLLENLEGKKVGVIQNELGKISVDGTVLKDEDIQMIELTRGSIFCSCLKLSFVQALVEMSEKELDYVFVESSGFGDPSNLEEILEATKILIGEKYDFKGCICLVDSLNFLNQFDEAETIERQVKHCNLAVLTKVDLVGEEQLNKIREKIREVNPVCPIVTSVMGKLDLSFLGQDLSKYQWAECEETTNSIETKPKTLYMNFEGEIEKEKLETFLKRMEESAYRIKGFFYVAGEGWQKVDMAGKQIVYTSYEPQEKSQLVFISRTGLAMIRSIKEEWETCVGLPMELKN